MLLAFMTINQYVLIINLSKPFRSYLGEDSGYNFINNMIEESKCCIEVMKKTF